MKEMAQVPRDSGAPAFDLDHGRAEDELVTNIPLSPHNNPGVDP
jgi:hypothetical protein